MKKEKLHVNRRSKPYLKRKMLVMFLYMMTLCFVQRSVATIYLVGGPPVTYADYDATPFRVAAEDSKVQYIYLASELTAAGAAPGMIQSIAFKFTFLASPMPANVTISMGHTSATTLSVPLTGLTAVYSAASVNPAVGWNTYNFSSPFNWNGIDNIVIEFCRDNNSRGTTSYLVETTDLGAGNHRTFCFFDDGLTACNFSMGGHITNPTTRPNCRFDIVPPSTPCTTPSAGTIVASSPASGGSVCANTTFSLGTTGSSFVSGLAYDWQYNAGSGWLSTGDTSFNYVVAGGINTATDYRLIVTCTATGTTDTSNTVSLSIKPFTTCYCIPTSSCSTRGGIVNVTMGALNNNSAMCAGGYSDFRGLGAQAVLTQAQSTTISVTDSVRGKKTSVGVWIDYDHSGSFDASEYTLLGTNNSYKNTPFRDTVTGTIAVPAGALTGVTAMRVRHAALVAITASGPCGTGTNVVGEYEDYLVNINPGTPCSGQPTAGTISSSVSSSGCTIPVILSASGYTSGVTGLAFQWQESTDNINFTNLGTATADYKNDTVSSTIQTKYYRLQLTCNNGTGLVAYSNTVTVAFTPINTFPWIYNVETQNTTINAIITGDCWSTSPTNTSPADPDGPGQYGWQVKGNGGSPPVAQTGPAGPYSGNKYYYTGADGGLQGDSAFLMAPFIDNSSLTAPELAFYYHMYGSDMGRLIIQVSSGGGSWISLDSLVGQQQTADTIPWLQKIVSLTGYAAPIQLRFLAIRGNGYKGSMALDDITVRQMATCPDPQALNAANVASTTADLSWAAGTATQWQVEYGIGKNFALGTGTREMATNNNPHTLGAVAPLTPSTSYTYFVREICGPNDTSAWSVRSPLFTTIATCTTPTALTATNMTATTADLGWTGMNPAMQWEIEYAKGGAFMIGTGAREASVSNSHNLGGITPLTPSTIYSYFVRSICGPGDTSVWSLRKSFATLASCDTPTALAATNITASTAQLGWTSNSIAADWEIEYAPGTGFTPGTGTRIAVTATSYTLGSATPLMAGTVYSCYVRSICAPGDTSVWSARATFRTDCNPVALPFIENFASASPTLPCWRVIDGNGDNDKWTTTSGEAKIYTDLNASDNNDWLILPPVTLTGNQRLKYSYKAENALEPNDYMIKIATAGSDTANFTQVLKPLTIVSNTSYQQEAINLYGYSGTVHIAFHVPPGGQDGWNLYIDDVIVEDIPSCPFPTNITASNQTANSIDIGWMPASTATQHQIEYAPGTGFTPGAGTRINSPSNPTTISGLNPATGYTFYVRDVCGAGDTSLWAGPITTFTTFPAVPPNDSCMAAVDISDGALYFGSTSGATQTLAPCDGITTNATDVWYKFTTGGTAGIITDSVNTAFNTTNVVIQMYSGSCGALTALTPVATSFYADGSPCVDGTLSGMEWASYNVAANTTYYIRVYSWHTSTPGSFSIQVTGTPTAIKLDKITAYNAGASNRIDWNTFSEERTDKFELERSSDGKMFHGIYEKQANGAASRYTYTDNNPAKGTNYYRLRMTDGSGGIAYSETVTAFVQTTAFAVKAYPNPVSHNLTIEVNGVKGADATVQVTDIAGKVLHTVKMNNSVEKIHMDGFADGIYLIKYSDASRTQIIKINKQ